MSFTRDDLAAYEAAKTAPVSAEPETPPEPKVEATKEESSTSEVTEPAELVEDGSSTEDVKAESSTATAEDPEGETPEAPVKGAARERIEELIIERNAVRKYAEYMLAEVEKYKAAANVAKPTDPAQDSASDEDREPALDDPDVQFDPVALVKKQNAWMKRQIRLQVAEGLKTELTQAEQQREITTIRNNFNSRVQEFKKTHPDFETVISNPNLPDLGKRAATLILKSEVGPAIAHHLAKNPDLAARIARMDEDSQGMALGRLEGQLSVAATTNKTSPRTVSKAPPPPRPVSSGSGQLSKNVSDMSMDEFVAHERDRKIKERENRRRARGAMR